MPLKFVKNYTRTIKISLMIILAINIASINMRVNKTILVGYHWSYDYIKFANLIKQDILSKNNQDPAHQQPVCVSGIEDIPYKQQWKPEILKEFNFNRFDPFRVSLLSTLNENRSIIINDVCPKGSWVYRIKDYKVYDDQGKHIGLFYRNFDQGLLSLKQGEVLTAAGFLEQAVQREPFLIRFLSGWPLNGGPLHELWLKEISQTIYNLYARYYDDDEKINHIDTLIRRESEDYGFALSILAYLKQKDGLAPEAEELLTKSSWFIPYEDVLESARKRGDGKAFFNEFQGFILSKKESWPKWERVKFLPIETYKGFDIVQYKKFYLATLHSEGPLDLAKFKAGEYAYNFSGRQKREIRQAIDMVVSPSNFETQSTAVIPTEKTEYKGFRIMKWGDIYYVFDRNMPVEPEKYADNTGALFKTRSMQELELVIDQFEKMSREYEK